MRGGTLGIRVPLQKRPSGDASRVGSVGEARLWLPSSLRADKYSDGDPGSLEPPSKLSASLLAERKPLGEYRGESMPRPRGSPIVNQLPSLGGSSSVPSGLRGEAQSRLSGSLAAGE